MYALLFLFLPPSVLEGLIQWWKISRGKRIMLSLADAAEWKPIRRKLDDSLLLLVFLALLLARFYPTPLQWMVMSWAKFYRELWVVSALLLIAAFAASLMGEQARVSVKGRLSLIPRWSLGLTIL
jgi:hypothetical protein